LKYLGLVLIISSLCYAATSIQIYCSEGSDWKKAFIWMQIKIGLLSFRIGTFCWGCDDALEIPTPLPAIDITVSVTILEL